MLHAHSHMLHSADTDNHSFHRICLPQVKLSSTRTERSEIWTGRKNRGNYGRRLAEF